MGLLDSQNPAQSLAFIRLPINFVVWIKVYILTHTTCVGMYITYIVNASTYPHEKKKQNKL